MNIRLAFFSVAWITVLVCSCASNSSMPQEDLWFTKSQVNLIVQVAGLQLPAMLGLVDILWDSEGHLILAGNYIKDEKNNSCFPGSTQDFKHNGSSYCSFIAKFRHEKTEWIFVQPYYTYTMTVDPNNHIEVASENALFKLSSAGQILWEKVVPNSSVNSHIFGKSSSHTRDKEGNFVILEQFTIRDLSITKLDKNNNRLWSTSVTVLVNLAIDDIVSKSYEYGEPVKDSLDEEKFFFDREGNILVTFSFLLSPSEELPCVRKVILVLKVTKDGKPLWSNKIISCTNSRPDRDTLISKIKTDSHNNVYLVGTIKNEPPRGRLDSKQPVFFGITPIILPHRLSPFIAKISPDGKFVWNYVFDAHVQGEGAFGNERFPYSFVYDIRPDTSNTMAFAGVFWGTATFPTTPPSTLKGFYNIFVFTADLEPKVTIPQQ